MIVRPNVKVNLGLSVLRKRSDGYHDLETLFVPYPAISDLLEITRADVDLADLTSQNRLAVARPLPLRHCRPRPAISSWAPPSYIAEGGMGFGTSGLPGPRQPG